LLYVLWNWVWKLFWRLLRGKISKDI
jgi:hypothetical protein